jgi:hypothetical protein
LGKSGAQLHEIVDCCSTYFIDLTRGRSLIPA